LGDFWEEFGESGGCWESFGRIRGIGLGGVVLAAEVPRVAEEGGGGLRIPEEGEMMAPETMVDIRLEI
jgi:hypothetical protein